MPREWIDAPSKIIGVVENRVTSYLSYADVDRTIPWSDPAVVFNLPTFSFTVDTTSAFDKVLFMYLVRGSGDPLIYVYNLIVCKPVVVWPATPHMNTI